MLPKPMQTYKLDNGPQIRSNVVIEHALQAMAMA